MSELENRIDSLLNGKATVGIAVWTDKGDMLRYNDHRTLPLAQCIPNSSMALAVLDKMDKQSISLDIVSIKASPNAAQYLQPLRKKFPDQDFTLRLGTDAIQHFPKRQQYLRHLDRICPGIKHINDYICRLSIDSFNLSETRRHALQLRGCIPLEYSFRYGRLRGTADEKVVLNKRLKDFLWQTMIDTETGANKLKGMLPAKTVVRTQDHYFLTAMPTV